ncbi:MAG: hypothetical protein ACRDYV_00815 [Acidimicrobiia bacterium]
MSPPHFPIRPDELLGQWRFRRLMAGTAEIEGFAVTAAEVPHKGGTTYGLRVSDGSSTLAYLPDHGPLALGPGPAGHGELHDAALALAGAVDLLVHDASTPPRSSPAGPTTAIRRRTTPWHWAPPPAPVTCCCSITGPPAPTTTSTPSSSGCGQEAREV